MSHQERRTIVSIIAGIVITTAYSISAYTQYQSDAISAVDTRAWAVMMMSYIGIGVVVTIITQIIYHILLAISVAITEREKDEKKINATIEASLVEDEMDKLIELKSLRVSFAIAGAGFFGGLIALILDYPASAMLNILFYSFSAGAIIEGFVKLYYYKKGI